MGGAAELDASSAPAQSTFFRTRVEPILKSRCLKCHGGEPKVRGHLRLDSREALLKGGDQGPAVTLDQPGESLILQAIRYEGLEMPPERKLPREEINALTQWVKEGLAWPGDRRRKVSADASSLGTPGKRPCRGRTGRTAR